MKTNPLDTFTGTERFKIRRRLGAGGMGVVYEAFDRERDERVALKTILRLDASTLYRFKNEFRSLADVTHPSLVRLYELFSEGNQWFFTMELVEGVDFLEFVCPDRTLPAEDTLDQTDAGEADRSTQKDSTPAASPADGANPLPAPADAESTASLGSTEMAGAGLESSRDQTDTMAPEASRLASTDVDPEGPSPPSPRPATTGSTAQGSGSESPVPSTTVEPATSLPAPEAGRPAVRRPDYARLREALRQLAEVLNELHAQGRLHRDIKPSNVLVTRRGRLVLLDFGLSTNVDARTDPETTDGHIVGTAAYMAPEQAGGCPVTAASDWYAVGVMLYRALTGRLPHGGKVLEILMEKQRSDPSRPAALFQDVPEELDRLCMDLLGRDPGERPPGEEILRRLGGVAGEASRLAAQRRLFVGRESQLAALSAAFKDMCQGQTVAVFVHGRSGVGKSSLIQRFLEGLFERGEAVILAGRCYEQESVAYKAVDTLIDSLSRYLRRLSRREADALMPRDVSTLAQVFPVLRRVEAVAEAPLRPHVVPDQLELRRRAFAALRELVARIGDRRPLVLAIDDLQWGDLDSAVLLSDLLRPPDAPVLLLVGSYRSEYATFSPFLRVLLDRESDGSHPRDHREVALEPLTLGEGRELALRLIGQDDPAAVALAETIVRESGGSPYFVYELVEYLKEGGELGEGGTLSTHFSLDSVLGRRIGRLPVEAASLLEVLALAGQPLRQAIACRAAGLGAEGFSGLALLRAQHLVRGTGLGSLDEVETYHDRIRETVSNHLSAERARELNGRLAWELEKAGGADPETLGVHFEGADELAKAGHYYGLAADEASEALAFDRAVKLYRRALELGPGDPAAARRIRARLGDALANVGRGVEAAHAYQEAAVDAEHLELIELQRRAAYQFLVSGHIDEGLSAFGAILDRVGLSLPPTPRRALFRLLLSRARLRLRGLGYRERAPAQVPGEKLELIDISRSVAVGISVVDVIRGADYQTRSLLLALQAGEPLRIALALGWEAVHVACQGRPAWRRTERLVAAAGSLANRLGHPHALGMASLSAGAAEFLIGRYRSGLELLNNAEAIFRERCTGVIWELDTARIFALWSLFYLGGLAELGERCQVIFHEASERGDRYMVATPGPFVGTVVRLAEDDLDGARRFAREALGPWSHQGFHIQHLNFYYGSLYIDSYAGDAAGAWRRITETEPLLESSLLLRIQQVQADVIQHKGRCAVAMAAVSADPEPLLRQAEKSARRLDRQQTPWACALAQLIKAGVASVRGDAGRAERLLADAAERFESADMGLFAASARRQLGQLRGGDEGRGLIERADAWMRAQSIRNPARMASCLAPGFPQA
ncbi:MAG: serine/threonine-protein kinase PknK [Isosphaerales bacterium]